MLEVQKKLRNKNRQVLMTKYERTMLLSKCSVCESKKSKFIKDEEAGRLLSSLGQLYVKFL